MRNQRIRRLCTSAVIVVMLSASCASMRTTRVGAVDKIDSHAFDVLGTTAMTLQALKDECPSGPTSPCPQSKKDAINAIIGPYDTARAAWLSYRSIVMSGKAGNFLELNHQLGLVVQSIADYRKAVKK